MMVDCSNGQTFHVVFFSATVYLCVTKREKIQRLNKTRYGFDQEVFFWRKEIKHFYNFQRTPWKYAVSLNLTTVYHLQFV